MFYLNLFLWKIRSFLRWLIVTDSDFSVQNDRSRFVVVFAVFGVNYVVARFTSVGRADFYRPPSDFILVWNTALVGHLAINANTCLGVMLNYTFLNVIWGSFTVKLEAGGARLRQSCLLTHR